MDNYLVKVVRDTTDFIENNILKPINLDVISKHVNFSKYYLNRIWFGMTSTYLIQYVRRRRLALSLSDLINTNHTIDFISSKYGFEYARSYNRAFKEEFQITPTKWRKNPAPLKILDRMNVDLMRSSGEGLVYFHSNVVMPSIDIAGLEYRIDNNKDDLRQIGYDFYLNHSKKVKNPEHKHIYIGYSLDPNDTTYTIYQPSLTINEHSIIPSNMKIIHIVPHKYGVFKYVGMHSPKELSSKTLNEVWTFITNTWMPTIEFNLNKRFYFEYINYELCDKDYCEYNLYIPISTF